MSPLCSGQRSDCEYCFVSSAPLLGWRGCDWGQVEHKGWCACGTSNSRCIRMNRHIDFTRHLMLEAVK